MKLGVVVLNWNGKEVTPRCLESLCGASCPADQIVVVDNASTDGSANLIRSQYPQVVLLENDSNLGFAEGCNVGIRYLLERAFDLILLLNNDAIVHSECLRELRRAARTQPAAAAFGATIYYFAAPGSVWYAGGSISRLTLDARHETRVDESPGSVRPTGFITGCCVMFRSDALRKIGLLDSDFFAYFEDVDWSLRATAAGSRLVHVSAAIVRHEVSHSFRRTGTRDESKAQYYWMRSQPLVFYLTYRNRLLLARKHAGGKIHLVFLVLRRLERAARHAAMLLLCGRTSQARAVVEGTMEGLRRRLRPARVERYLRVAAARTS